MRNMIEYKKYKSMTLQWLYHVIPFCLLFLSWEIIARTVLAPYNFPPLSVVVQAFSPSLAYHLGITLAFSFLELLIISVVGLPLGKLMYTSKKLKWILSPIFWFLIFAIGTAIVIKAPFMILLFGVSQLLIVFQSILVPILLVALISSNGHRMVAIKMGYLLCLSFQIMGEMTFGTTSVGIGQMLSVFYHLHESVLLYATLLLIGFAGLFVEEIFLRYVGNKFKIQ